MTGVGQLELHRSRQRLHDLRTLVPQLGVLLRDAIQYVLDVSYLGVPCRLCGLGEEIFGHTTVALIDCDLLIELVLDQPPHLAGIRARHAGSGHQRERRLEQSKTLADVLRDPRKAKQLVELFARTRHRRDGLERHLRRIDQRYLKRRRGWTTLQPRDR